MSTPQETFTLKHMRIVGVVIVIISVAQIGVASTVSGLTNWQVGSWWVGILSFITGFLAIIPINRGIVIVSCILSALSIPLCITGVVVDGFMYKTTSALDFCLNQETGDTYGNTAYLPKAAECAYDHSQTCVCVQGSKDNVCFLFDPTNGDDCEQFLATVSELLLTSLVLVLINLLLAISYSPLPCIVLCNADVPPAGHHPNHLIAVATPAGPSVPVKQLRNW